MEQPSNMPGEQVLHLGPPVMRRARADDWERLRPIVKQLYVTEGKKLEDVMAFVRSQHSLTASKRSFKYHIRAWRFDKKHKERDMVAIRRKMNERGAVGKQTLVRVRGLLVNLEDMEKYFARRKNKPVSEEVVDAPTPSDVCCETPTQVLSPCPDGNDDVEMIDPDLSTSAPGSSMVVQNQQEPVASLKEFVFDEEVIGYVAQKFGAYQQYLSDYSRVSRSPSPPPFLLVPEQLLFCIRAYHEGSLRCGAWIDPGDGYLISASHSQKANEDWQNLQSFRDFITLASNLADKRAYVELRRAMSRACALIQPLLKHGPPHTLATILEMIHILARGHPDIADKLRTHVQDVARHLIHDNSPWRQICILLGDLDRSTLQSAIIQCYRSVADQLSVGLSPLNPTAVETRLDFIDEAYRNDLPLAERLLRELLTQCKQSSSPTSQVLNIMAILADNLMLQKRHEEAEEVAREILFRAEEAENSLSEITATDLLAWCQYCQGDLQGAEDNLRDAIDMAIDYDSEGDPYVIQLLGYLEGWLREWDRAEEADELKVKIGELIGKDDIDEEAERLQATQIDYVPG